MSESNGATAPALVSVTANRAATLRTYIDMRDELWQELSVKGTAKLESRSLGLLELGNRVVRTLLQSTAGVSLMRALELLRCDVCDSWLAMSRRELRAFNRESPFPINESEVVAHLKVALATDSELIPQPGPSSTP